jgi:hypothetical protein
MNKMLLVLFVFVILEIFNCSYTSNEINFNDMIRRVDYIENHRSTREYIINAIKNGYVIDGMSPGEVTASIGNPVNIKTDKETQIWIYTSNRYKKIYFEFGKVVKIK